MAAEGRFKHPVFPPIGRRRKNTILSIETESGELVDQGEIQKHIVEFYKDLFGYEHDKGTHLSSIFGTRTNFKDSVWGGFDNPLRMKSKELFLI